MSDRLLKILVGALAILVAAWVVARFVAGRGGAPEPAGFELAAAAQLELDSVLVEAADDTVRLRAGDGWTVNGYEATAEAGESLKRAFEEARVGGLVSRNPENHERLGVTEALGRRLTVYAGGAPQLSFIVGERARSFDQAYVRRVGEDGVYTLRGTLISLARRGVDEWRNKEILAASREDIQRVEFTYPDESFALVRDSVAWHLEPSGAAAQTGVVSSLLGQLAGLRAIGFAADSVADTLSWDPPRGRVRVEGPVGADLGELVFLDRGDVGYYLRRAGAPVVYTVSSYTGQQILKREEDLAAGEEH
jgi:hypothetical protein